MENANDLQNLAKLTKDNLARSEEILAISKDIKKYIQLTQVWATFRLLLILIPIILGFIYLPPFIKDAINSYKSLINQ